MNLSVIKDNYVPFDLFFEAFLESANNIEVVSIEEWKEEWMQIETIINKMSLSLPDYEKDRDEIKNRLSESKYMGHHSQRFNDTYKPHYRIISRKIFEEKLLPLLKTVN